MAEIHEPVLVLAPTGRDALLISDVLRTRYPTHICLDLDQFARGLLEHAAAGLLAQEALRPGAVQALGRALREQPPWSDVPLILMTARRASDPGIRKLQEHGANITLLERPLRVDTLTTAVDSAVRQRKRQYELRDRLIEEQRTEERLRQTQKLESLGILAGGIAHDFNNLLTGIIGNISIALDREPEGSASSNYLMDAIHASERAADLTRQLLAYSGKGRFAIQNLDVSDTVHQINTLIQTSIPKNVHVRLNLGDRLPCIEADPSQFQQIVMNLIINAAEAIGSEKDGLVTVTTGVTYADENYLRRALGSDSAVPGEYVYLEVRDDGSGIDEATLQKIFDPFFTTKFMGRGLGLAAVLGIVRGHRGALEVESTPGKGTSFQVLFPTVPDVEPERKRAASRRDLSGTGTILVVDDEEIVRKIARNTLESWGYRVLLADNGQIATDIFSRSRDEIALVLLDLTMPVMNGEQAFRKLQSISPGVPVILSSGYDEADAMARFKGVGLAGFIQKPYSSGQLAECVKRVFETARAGKH